MRLFANLLPGKGAVYGGAAVLLGLMPQPFTSFISGADQRVIQLPDQSPRDWLMTNSARRAIQKDEQLAALNLGVSVTNKVATLWGSLPSKEMLQHAEETVKKVNGIAAVMNDCRIVAADPLPQAVADAVKKALAPPEEPNTSAKTTANTNRIVAKPPTDAVTARTGEPSELPPVRPAPPAAVLLPPTTIASVVDTDDLEALRQSDKRFRELKLDVKDGVVKVNGVVAKMKDAWELAEKLNALASVRQVILGKVVEE